MFEIGVFFALLTIGYVSGTIAEQRHFRSIRERESELAPILTFSTRHLPDFDSAVEASLVTGNVAVSIDYFKRVAAGLRLMFGGRVAVYETLVERARREAILRMKEDARRRGATYVFNVKLETASITKGAQNQVSCVEVYAYGTCVVEHS